MSNNKDITLDYANMPSHVAVIMDGNGRWAKARGLDRSLGHAEGVNTVRKITEEASELGLKYLTLYTFSTENWNRPKEEVDALMDLIVMAIERETPDLIKNNVKLATIGDIDKLPAHTRATLEECMRRTAPGTGLTLVLALSYSSHSEITGAMRKIAEEVKNGNVSPEEITSELISSKLHTSSMPDPDLLIRTGGEKRISNFLLWQIAYTELYFTPTYWPDFSKENFREAIHHYQTRERRFGLTSDQLPAADSSLE